MKTFTIAAFAALASVGSAQLSNIPSCALQCFLAPLQSDGCSSLTDFECHCKKGAELLGKVQPCVQGACEQEDQAKAISAVQDTCKAAGVPINIPGASAAPSMASSAVASATSAAASMASSAAASASSMASSVMSEASAVESAASSMASEMSSAMMTGTPTASESMMSMTPSASMSEFTGAAAQATQAVGILGAAALAMLAL
ncbi:uncharacterized protein J4E87_004966 [Alternaria ethzedia]|uniref:uncharacterized protein n=1 Tax=Alternaria ethzedia TaxID=181014 RepID=UPI0020C230FC|nr:uncharacterized protein J4E87_004966 [Alternaria ethzedia]KAI4625120.1 hypothetical protein J4E87_004966 [Alternaria ethzedia]